MADPCCDHHAVEALIVTYAERVDLGDFAGVGALFADATYRAANGDDVSVAEGAAAVTAQFEALVRRYPDGTPRTKHVTTNVVVDVGAGGDPDAATSRCYFTVFQQTDELPLQPIIAGRYHDRFERVGGTWRFADRLIFSDLIGDLSRHLLVDVFGGAGG
jgi:hypothetical protein